MAGVADGRSARTVVACRKRNEEILIQPRRLIDFVVAGTVGTAVARAVTVVGNIRARSACLFPHVLTTDAGQAAGGIVTDVLKQDLCIRCHAVADIPIAGSRGGRRAGVASNRATGMSTVEAGGALSTGAEPVVVIWRCARHHEITVDLVVRIHGAGGWRVGVLGRRHGGDDATALVEIDEEFLIAIEAGIGDRHNLVAAGQTLAPDRGLRSGRAGAGRGLIGLHRADGIAVVQYRHFEACHPADFVDDSGLAEEGRQVAALDAKPHVRQIADHVAAGEYAMSDRAFELLAEAALMFTTETEHVDDHRVDVAGNVQQIRGDLPCRLPRTDKTHIAVTAQTLIGRIVQSHQIGIVRNVLDDFGAKLAQVVGAQTLAGIELHDGKPAAGNLRQRAQIQTLGGRIKNARLQYQGFGVLCCRDLLDARRMSCARLHRDWTCHCRHRQRKNQTHCHCQWCLTKIHGWSSPALWPSNVVR